MEETELRERLEYIAARTAPPPQDPGGLAAAVVDRHRSARRRQAGLVAVLAIVLVLVPGVRYLTSAEPEPAAPPADPVETVEIFTLPTRGSLADDTEFLDGILRLPWILQNEPPRTEIPVEDTHVVWAGDSDAGRWALLAGVEPGAAPRRSSDAALRLAWFIGPRGAAPEQMTMQLSLFDVDPELPSALWDPASGATVVVAAPDDRIEVSDVPKISASGAITRTFEEVPALNGVATLFDIRSGSSAGDAALRYRVQRNGSWTTSPPNSAIPEAAGWPPILSDGTPSPTDDVAITRLRDAPPAHPGDAAAPTLIADLLTRTGLAPESLTATVLWAGDLQSRGGGTVRATVMAVELPSGAIYVGGVLGHAPRAGPSSIFCGAELRAAGTPVEELVTVVHCDPEPGRDVPADNGRLVVVAPPDAATVRTLDTEGRPVGTYQMTDGVAVVPAPENLQANVEVLDADGDTVDARAPMDHADLSGD
jgi:hypothetical protein